MATPPSETKASLVAGNTTESNTSEKECEFIKNLEKLGSFTLGNINSDEKLTEKKPENLGAYILKPFDNKMRIKGGIFDFKPPKEKPSVPTNFLKFIPLTGSDSMIKNGIATDVSTRHQCISLMKEYSGKSFEELRFEYYRYMERWNSRNPTLQKRKLSFCNINSTFEKTNTTGKNFLFGATDTSGVSELLKGLEELFLSGKYSDVTLTVQNKEFNAHKVILAIQSPVFSAMMEHETKEKATGVVNIPDFDPEPFSVFLHFLYTGSTKKLNPDNVLDLYTIADKYQVFKLCKICVNFMKNCITVQNFCDILALSLRHHEKELTDMATQFFVKNSTEIAVTVDWSSFMTENPVVANELFLKALRLQKDASKPLQR